MSVIRPFSDVDLHAYVDDQISPERRSAIANYLKATPVEAARVEAWRRQNQAIRGLFGGAASEPVPIWLTVGHLAAGRTPREQGPAAHARTGWIGDAGRLLPRKLPRLGMSAPWAAALGMVFAFAAGLLAPTLTPRLAVGVEHLFPSGPRADALAQIAARTIEAHRTFGLDPDNPAEMAGAEPGALAAWLQRRTLFPVRIPDLTTAGWTLRGGRIVPADGGPAALLVYQDGFGDRLSLVTARADNPAPFDTSFRIAKGPALVWLDGPLAFGLATSREGGWLPDHAALLYRAVYESRGD